MRSSYVVLVAALTAPLVQAYVPAVAPRTALTGCARCAPVLAAEKGGDAAKVEQNAAFISESIIGVAGIFVGEGSLFDDWQKEREKEKAEKAKLAKKSGKTATRKKTPTKIMGKGSKAAAEALPKKRWWRPRRFILVGKKLE